MVRADGELERVSVKYARRRLSFETGECLFHLVDPHGQIAALCAVEAYRWARYIWLRTDVSAFAWSIDLE